MRIVVIGNAGGGKSTLSKRLAALHAVPYHEIDAFQWLEGWQLASQSDFDAAHCAVINKQAWLLDGLGRMSSVKSRLAAATHIVHIDLPIWQHYFLAANRHADAMKGTSSEVPGGLAKLPALKVVFKMISEVDEVCTPQLRKFVAEAKSQGASLQVVRDMDDLDGFSLAL